jgi:rhamnosyltransferase
MRASVVIPTKNGGPLFRRVLPAVLGQQTGFEFDVIVIDSGSTDGTSDFVRDAAKNDPRLRLIEIAPEKFQHGRTRNEAIASSRGEIIAMTTQDAMPASENWLANLVRGLTQRDDIAGAYGRHLPYPESPLCMRRGIITQFDYIETKWPAVMKLEPDRAANDTAYRQALHFFSNNNSALRRAVWEKIPFPDVAFGEDQTWAENVMKAGFAKAYVADAVVFHSHTYTMRETFRRSREEAAAFHKNFGYRLRPSFASVPATFARLVLADARFVREHPAESKGLREVIASAPLNLARMLGEYAGSRDR